jgi:peptidoglycan/LPS O-acetylase OafA/YrhL
VKSVQLSNRFKGIYRENNFDLIRLFAAIQVVVVHVSAHFQLDGWSFLRSFPGVPVFFFVSGLLVSHSFVSSDGIFDYARKRFLRLLPALWLCFLCCLLFVVFVGYLSFDDFWSLEFLLWFSAQVSVFQFYNPEFMRGYGVGVLNGSLWTISVEIQFYVLVYFLFLGLSRLGPKYKTVCLVTLISIFAVFNRIYFDLKSADESLWVKLLGVSFVPWFYMFLFGVLFRLHFSSFHRLLCGKFIPAITVYMILNYFFPGGG